MISADKLSIRRRFRVIRAEFSRAMDPDVRAKAFASPPRALRARLRGARVVAVYLAMIDEADPIELARLAETSGATICLPRINMEDGTMDFATWSAASSVLRAGPLDIAQPSSDAPGITPDLIVTPLIAFDRRLSRLGQGKGYYDRTFATYPQAFRLGLAWSVQEAKHIPIEAWDMPLHAVLTEHELIETAR